MEKETVIAKIRVSFDFGTSYYHWVERVVERYNGKNTQDNNGNYIPWFVRQGGRDFLREYKGTWNRILIEESEVAIREYFASFGLSDNFQPTVKISETYEGSWIIDAAVVVAGSVGSVYATLKGISEIPEMIEGFSKIKDKISNPFRRKINSKTIEILADTTQREQLPPPPETVFEIKDFVIDARPMLALTPSEMKTHQIHLSVGVSADAFTLENLGENIIRDLRVGLFKSKTQKNQWSFGDAFVGTIGILSPKQTVSKNLFEFVNDAGKQLQIEDYELPLYIDCWIQDNSGIYLFMFYLDK